MVLGANYLPFISSILFKKRPKIFIPFDNFGVAKATTFPANYVTINTYQLTEHFLVYGKNSRGSHGPNTCH
jgi:hypothetical protein